MKSELDLYIEAIQKEHDFWKNELETSIEEGDFHYAASCQNFLFRVKRQLRIAKCLKNPNFKEIDKLEMWIRNKKKMLNSKRFYNDYSSDEIRKYASDYMKEKLEKDEKELSRLKSIVPQPRLDNDRLYQLFEKLVNKKITQIDLEIFENKLKIRCNSKGNDLRISIRWLDKFHADHFISDQAKSILTKLGFDLDNYEMIIENFNASNISSLIEKLAIIMFDGFELIGNKTINVRYK